MRRFRSRPAATAVLLLATLASTSVVALGHEHGALAIGAGHSELPTFVAGHSEPDRTVHVESATRVESSPCIACLHRQRQYAAGSLSPSLDAFAPSLSTVAIEGEPTCVGGPYRLPASRAPPAA